MVITNVICSKCGAVEEFDEALAQGWLIAPRLDKPQGHMMIRCPRHVTDYARRLCGLKQQYYQLHKEKLRERKRVPWYAGLRRPGVE